MVGNILDTFSGTISAMELESGEVELVKNPPPNDAYLNDEDAADHSVGIISGATLPNDVSGTVEVIPVAAELDNDSSISEETSGSNWKQWWNKGNHTFNKMGLFCRRIVAVSFAPRFCW